MNNELIFNRYKQKNNTYAWFRRKIVRVFHLFFPSQLGLGRISGHFQYPAQPRSQHLQATKGKIPSYLWGKINLSLINPVKKRGDSCLFISYINASHEILSAQFLYLHTQHTHIYMFLCTSNLLHPIKGIYPWTRASDSKHLPACIDQ